MVVVKLMGGLGNQLFQYACGRALATRLETDLILDVDSLLDRTPRKNFIFRDFDLDIFELKEYFLFNDKLKRKFNRKSIFKHSKVEIKEEGFYYNTIINEVKKRNIYLDGYWQSYKYFDKIVFDLRKELKFRLPLSEKQIELRKKINQCKSVCINFRRTDFTSVTTAVETHGVTSLDYYHKALQVIKDKVGNDLSIFVFSDDIEWCKANFIITDSIYFVSHEEYKGERFSAYLELMTQCKYFIIPNSTFAWWAAWLSDFDDKIVITPNKWFEDPILQSQTKDLRPNSWITI